MLLFIFNNEIYSIYAFIKIDFIWKELTVGFILIFRHFVSFGEYVKNFLSFGFSFLLYIKKLIIIIKYNIYIYILNI